MTSAQKYLLVILSTLFWHENDLISNTWPTVSNFPAGHVGLVWFAWVQACGELCISFMNNVHINSQAVCLALSA